MAKTRSTGDTDPIDSSDTTGQETQPTVSKYISGQYIYLGPPFMTGGKFYSTVSIFDNGIPGDLKAICEKDAYFRLLIVTADRVGQARAELSDPDSARSMAFKTVLAKLKVEAQKAKKGGK